MLLASCGGEDKQSRPSATPTQSAPAVAPPPNLSTQQVKAGLLSSREVGSEIKQTGIAVEAIQKKQAPMCSLSGIKLPGQPETTIRQFSNPATGKGEVKYAQLIARYQDAPGAANAYAALQKAARACPSKQHVPPKKVNANFTLFAHDDTWRVSEDSLAGWTHLRGFERQKYSASASKENIFYFTYDYAVRGNLVITTLYWERTSPSKPSDPISKRAAELLDKQLKKLG
ncbi:hypothetical protein [Actinomadura sp. 6N118]|uniref:hypothetical protein n=1 Tax=Actinomadura sp. 6N118 TaxID=3375151 RepID=UPI003795B3C2